MTYKLQTIHSFSKVGKRTQNEDTLYPALDNNANSSLDLPKVEGLFMICDGVGGSNKGEVASAITCEKLPVYLYNSPPSDKEPLSPIYMQHAIKWVESAFDHYIAENDTSMGMGTTLAMLYLNDSGANIAWIGDSRVYHIRKGKILYQTQDHSLVNELIKLGQITPEQARTHRQKNVILRAIQGGNNPIDAELYFIPWEEIQQGDYFMICSDGITETWQNEDLIELFAHTFSDTEIANYLDQACEINSRDNYSCILLNIGAQKVVEIPATTPVIIPQVENEVEIVNLIEQTEILVPEKIEIVAKEEIIIPKKEEVVPKVEAVLPKQELSTPIIAPVIKKTETSAPKVEAAMPTVEMSQPKSGNSWIWVLLIACLIVGGVCGWIWYNLYGSGSDNELFRNYYTVAAEKVKNCEETGKCAEAKGVTNQARVAAETMEEHRRVDSLQVRIAKKEDEVRKKATFNAPDEITDKGKDDTRAAGAPKSQTPTPKAPQNGLPSKVTSPKTTTSTKPSTTSAVTTKTSATTTKPSTPPSSTVTKEPAVSPFTPIKKETPKNMPVTTKPPVTGTTKTTK